MDCSTPGLPVYHQLLESTQTHVHWYGDAIQPSHPLSSPSLLAFNLSQHQGFLVSQFFTSGGQSIGVSASALVFSFSFFLKYFYFYFILLYNTVLVLPYTDMNPPRVYTSSQSWIPLPPSTPYHPSGSSPCTSPKHPVPCIEHRLALCFLHDSTYVSMPFSQIIPPSPSPSESKSPFYTSVSLLLAHIQGHHYHLSTFCTYTQWSITQPLKRINLNQFWWDGWNWSRLYRVK